MEIDLGTEALESETKRTTWADKIEGYGKYLGADGWYSYDFDSSLKPIVLILCPGERRRTGIITTIRAHGGKGSYWCATFEDFARYGFFGSIWHTPKGGEPRSLADHYTR